LGRVGSILNKVKKGDFKGAYKEAKQTKQDVTRAYPKYKEGGK